MTQKVTDYLGWFRFTEPPFRLSPDIDFFFPSKAHKQAIEILNYGISRGEGFMVLSGQAGTGKTMLLRLLLKGLGEEKQAAVIVTPAVSPQGLMGLLLEELKIPLKPERSELALLLKDFQEHVITLAQKGKGLLIVVDEAQDLPLETIEQLRLLSNIETGKRKLIQILLVGQPEIKNLLADPRLCQLTQRIVINEALNPLSADETADYVRFRLSKAGRPDVKIEKGFFPVLYKRTQGLPRLINRAMDRTLLMAAASGAQELKCVHLKEALTTLPEPGFLHKKPRFYIPNKNVARSLTMALLGSGMGAALCFVLFSANIINTPSSLGGARTSRIQRTFKHAEVTGFPAKVTVASARIHAQPSKNSPVLSIAKEGHGLLILEETGRWCKVMSKNGQGVELYGWLLKKQVERSFSAANTFSKKEMDRPEKRQRPI